MVAGGRGQVGKVGEVGKRGQRCRLPVTNKSWGSNAQHGDMVNNTVLYI